jgi:predicted O-methyltransferase YrrM
MKQILFPKKMASGVVDFVARHAHNALRDAENVDICLSTLCRPEALTEIRFPVAYVEFLRTCIEHARCGVKEVKRDSGTDNDSERFTTLLEVLGSSLPPIEFSVAKTIAVIADHFRTLRQPLEIAWAGDISHSFQAASSFGKKGRVLSTIVRFARTRRCLELGTAYGMSALFILEAIRNNLATGHLQTIEAWDPQYSLSSSMLKERYGDMVLCHLGNIQDELPKLAKTAGPFDFMFHDDGHSRETYIRDFNAVKDAFSPGAVVLFDDIRWEDLRMTKGRPARCYEGWMEVCADSRVRRAVEVDYNLGLLLLR